jgi:branched-chain amino acid transport system substrate-binding protein
MTKRFSRRAAAATIVASGLALIASNAAAADKVKIGFVSTLSGPSSALGIDIRDGFLLAVKLNGGKLDGLPAEVIVSDDQFNRRRQKLFEKNVKRAQGRLHDRRRVLEHHVAAARGDRQQVIYISPNARLRRWPARTATRSSSRSRVAERCVPRGGRPVREHARPEGAQLVAPNYQAGRTRSPASSAPSRARSSARTTKLGQLDYAAELAEIRAAKPQAVYISCRRNGINFIKQYVGAGLGKDTTLPLPGFSADQDVINPVGARWRASSTPRTGRLTANAATRSSSPSSRKNTSACRRSTRRRATTTQLIAAAVRDTKGSSRIRRC